MLSWRLDGGAVAQVIDGPWSRLGARASEPLRERSSQGVRPCYGKDIAKVTSKLQVTVPKRIADRYGIRPGDDIDWLEAGDAIRVLPGGDRPEEPGLAERRVELFDAATARQHERQAADARAPGPEGREWRREDLYVRGRAD